MESFRTSVAMRLDEVMYTFSIIVACYTMDPRSKTRFPVDGACFRAFPVLNLDRLAAAMLIAPDEAFSALPRAGPVCDLRGSLQYGGADTAIYCFATTVGSPPSSK